MFDLFKHRKIKKLLSQFVLADSENQKTELISQMSQEGKTAFSCIVEAFQNKTLDPIKGKILLEKLYDDSLIDNLLALIGDTNDLVRGAAKKVVLKNITKEVLQKLVDNLQSSNIYMKTSSAELLCGKKSLSCVLDLVSLYNKSGINIKLSIISILGETGGDISIKHLINALRNKEWRIRVRAVRSLGKMKIPKSVEPLIEILSEKDPQLKKSALDALMEIGDKRAAAPILNLLKDEDMIIRQKAVDCINQLGDAQIIPQVLQLMRDPDTNTRRCAVEIINKMKDPKTGEGLVKAMKDSDWWVRNIAIDALAIIKGENTINILIAMLNDSDENIRRSAVEFFNKVSDASAVGPLIGLLQDKDWWVREKAVTALGRLKDPRAIKPLIGLSGDEEIKHIIPGALAKIGGKEVISPILDFLRDSQKQVRIEAIIALTNFKGSEIVSGLKEALLDSEEDVKSEASKALKKITGKIFKGKERKPAEGPSPRREVGAKAPEGSILTEAIVVVDLCNSTSIADKYGNQFALNLTKVLTDATYILVKQENAQFIKSTGDGFLITFPKIENAVQFALHLRRDIKKHNKTVEGSNIIELRFAINFGETRIDAKEDRLGVATNMTFRVEGVKKEDLIEIDDGIKKDEMPGTNRILITENVVEDAEKMEGLKGNLLGLFELKGLSGLHRIYELIAK